ncbi:hypothetical protein Vadar_002492 [Vaccinium darrowii]|uniref:Uncharacterized protein n=1 Tax=Vaccinium darrowii TaxID=229202 RepID=A0ACB7WXI5_9ERIC|nr:hypothetical protein Vadar_002492 [Vaccinium darrowii]
MYSLCLAYIADVYRGGFSHLVVRIRFTYCCYKVLSDVVVRGFGSEIVLEVSQVERAVGFGGSNGSGAGLCSNSASCSISKGEGLAEFHSKCSNSIVGGVVGFGGSSGSFGGLSFDGGSCSMSKRKGLAEFHSEWRLEVEKERDLLPMFCEHRDRPLLSDGSCHLIKEVNQKFEGGEIEFRDSLANFNNVHTCGVANLSTRHSRVSSSLIGRLVSDDIRTTPPKRARDVVTDLKGLYGVDVLYKWACSSVKKGKSEAFGDYAASYDDLRWFGEAVRNFDPGSVFNIELNFKGCLLSASVKDGNRGRHLPVTQLVDCIRLKMMEQMCFRREIAAKWHHVICPKMDEALANAFQESKSWEVKFSLSDVLEVLCDPSVLLDIGRRT